MKVSVIIPVYNTELYLRECLDSVLAQTHRDMEIIVVDDGSTDSSAAICDDYAAMDTGVRVLHCENGGLSVARNRGIAVATGDYVTFVDSDDYIHPEMLSVLLSAQADVVSCRFTRNEKELGIGSPVFKFHDSTEAAEGILYQKKAFTPSACAHLLKRELLSDESLFRTGILYEDLDWLYRVYQSASGVKNCSSRLYFYRDTDGSILNKWNPRRLDVLDVTARIEEYFAGNPRLLAAARDRRMSAAFNIFMLNAQNENDPELAQRCYDIIRERRNQSLLNPQVRLKNKLGAIASYFGKNLLSKLSWL